MRQSKNHFLESSTQKQLSKSQRVHFNCNYNQTVCFKSPAPDTLRNQNPKERKELNPKQREINKKSTDVFKRKIFKRRSLLSRGLPINAESPSSQWIAIRFSLTIFFSQDNCTLYDSFFLFSNVICVCPSVIMLLIGHLKSSPRIICLKTRDV